MTIAVAAAPPSENRLDYLDALRGFAALWVVAVHTALVPGPSLIIPSWLQPFVLSGSMGVELFFAVSAFSLCIAMVKHAKEPRPILGFTIRRFFRIAPLFYIMLLVMLAWSPFNQNWSVFEVIGNILFVFNFVPGWQPSIVWAGWTIGIEMPFYVIFPILFYKIRNLTAAITLFFACVVLAEIVRLIAVYLLSDPNTYMMYSVFNKMPVFACGFIAYFALPILKNRPDHKEIGRLLLVFSVFCFFMIVANRIALFESYHWRGIMFCALIIGLGLNPITSIVNRATRYIGSISYSIYLTHMPVLLALNPLSRKIEELETSHTVSYLIILFTTISGSIIVSSVVYRFLEVPSNNIGRKVSKLMTAS